eukprot:577942_1
MSLSTLGTLLVITWFFSLPLASDDCPNEGFKIVAKHKHPFQLNHSHKRYWIAFGSKGKWVINLVDSGTVMNELYFFCDKRYFPSFQKIDKDNLPVCCASPHSIDEAIQPQAQAQAQHAQSHPFAILPGSYYTSLNAHNSDFQPATFKTDNAPQDTRKIYWMQRIKTKQSISTGSIMPILQLPKTTTDIVTSILLPMQMTPGVYMKMKSIGNSNVEFGVIPRDEAEQCLVTDLFQECDTRIKNDIVVFQVHCPEYSLIRFGFNSDGIFPIAEFLNCDDRLMSNAEHEPNIIKSVAKKMVPPRGPHAAREILYYPISKLYPATQYPPSYNSVQLGWKLGAFCGSCPSTSFKLTISQSEAQSNKERLQHALGITATTSAAIPHLSPTVKYTRTWYKEAAVTITSGRATNIAASCNGLDLWYWSVRVGTWGEGNTVIPTQFFYCTDRPTPPICKPRITAEMDATAYGRLCSGQDKDSDFDLAKAQDTDQSPAWQTPHGGRPQPLRLQGQRGNEGALNVVQSDINHIMPRSHLKRAESSLIRANPLPVQQANEPNPLVRSNSAILSAEQANGPNTAAHIDYIDIWNGEDMHDKGLFLARVTYGVDDLSQIGYDDDDDSDSVAQNAYIPYYSVYNGDFQSTANNTDVFIPFFIVLCVLCALCIVVIACICVVGCFVFSKHTSIQKHTNRLNEVTSYEV